MALPNTKELKELLKLLRSQGVIQFGSGDLNLVLSEHLPVTNRKTRTHDIVSDEDVLTPEEEAERILFYSTTNPSEPVSE